MHDGLIRGERCLYWGQRPRYAIVLQHLQARGVSLASLPGDAKVLFVDTDMLHPSFDPNEQAAALQGVIQETQSRGYAGLRVVGHPDEQTRKLLSHEQLAAFETNLTGIFEDGHATGLCIFNQRSAGSSYLETALTSHPATIVAGHLCPNPLFQFREEANGQSGGRDGMTQAWMWMLNGLLQNALNQQLFEAESAALIVEAARLDNREKAARHHISLLTRAIEARDRLILTAARWLARPLPLMCNHFENLANDENFAQYHDVIQSCGDHLAAVMRLSRGLEEVSSYLQLQVVLRPEPLDIVDVANAAIAEIKDDPTVAPIDVVMESSGPISGEWDRLRLTRLFHSLVRTSREQGYGTALLLHLEDLGRSVRIRLAFRLSHVATLSESGEHERSMAYGPFGESDYERLAVQLWSARELVRVMGGTLGVSTWADARVAFTLDLPKTSPPPHPQPDEA
jgi:hypothetical protein